MGMLFVQQFVSADGFAANAQNEFDLFDDVEGDPSEFEQSNLEWLEPVGAIILERDDVPDVRELLAHPPGRRGAGRAEDQLVAQVRLLPLGETVGNLVAADYAVDVADR